MITFAVEINPGEQYSPAIWVRALKGDTVRKICARRGHPEEAHKVCQMNHIRNPGKVLRTGRLVKLPGLLKKGDVLHVLADDPPPLVKNGYAKYDVVQRVGREGVSRFTGYEPIVYDIPIQWEKYADHAADGSTIESEIKLLERFAGRGQFPGAATSEPAVLRISVTNSAGRDVWLLPPNYQWSPSNPSAPLWRISNLTWDANPLRHRSGRRRRQRCVVEVTKYTPISSAVRSAAQRSKNRHPKQTAGSKSGGAGL